MEKIYIIRSENLENLIQWSHFRLINTFITQEKANRNEKNNWKINCNKQIYK